MISHDVVALTQKLIAIRSVSSQSNATISAVIAQLLADAGWQVEQTHYDDENGEQKVNLVAKLGQGVGGLAFCSHSDTVPGQEQDWAAFEPEIREGKLFGRGSCDMKGPLAATLVAALAIDPATLAKPLYIIVTSDEELGLLGAKFIVEQSQLLRESKPEYAIIAEPTSLAPVYSHKGFGRIVATAAGKAAHSSTGLGKSALLQAAPFLNDLHAIGELLESDPSFRNDEYTPPTQTLNAMIETEPTAINVTAERAIIKVSFRPMPNSRSEEIHALIIESAEAHGLTVSDHYLHPVICPQESALVQAAVQVTGREPTTVSFGTDGGHLQHVIDQIVILGPGSIAVAHTTAEFVPVAELHEAVEIYRQLITHLCALP